MSYGNPYDKKTCRTRRKGPEPKSMAREAAGISSEQEPPRRTNEARVAAVMERVRARVQLRKQRRMAGVLVFAALAAGFALGAAAYHWKEVD